MQYQVGANGPEVLAMEDKMETVSAWRRFLRRLRGREAVLVQGQPVHDPRRWGFSIDAARSARGEALRLAAQTLHPDMDEDDVMKRAKRFETYLLTGATEAG